MAVLDSLINLFPGVAATLEFMKDLAVLGGGVAVAGVVLAWLRRLQLRGAVTLEARGRGLSDRSATFLSRLLWRDGPELARDLLRSPELLRTRLANDLAAIRHPDSAARFAQLAARLVEEMRLRDPVVPDGPLLFEAITLRDPSDSRAVACTGYVVTVDGDSIAFVSVDRCPWPVRHDLLLERSTPEATEPLVVTLLLRPMPGSREWVVSHQLSQGGTGFRKIERHSCLIEAWTLPTTAGAYTLRGRLQDGEPLAPSALEKLEAWPRRQSVTIEDLSSDGARLVTDDEFCRGDHFYLALSQPSGQLAALPLTEVVSVRSDDQGRRILGTRFCAVRLKERVVLADYAQETSETAVALGQ